MRILTKKSCFFPLLFSPLLNLFLFFTSTNSILPITYWVTLSSEFYTVRHNIYLSPFPFSPSPFLHFLHSLLFALSIIHCLSYRMSILSYVYPMSVLCLSLGSESPCHQDPFHNILCQVYGTKHVLLFPPEQHVRTYGCP